MRKILFTLFCVAILLGLMIPGSTVLADSTWSEMTSGTLYWLRGVWGTSSADVYTVGGGGTILHYDGSEWSVMASGTNETLNAVWCMSSSDVYVVGNDGIVLRGTR